MTEISPGPAFEKARPRVVLYTFGSLGDLHPYLAVGLGLKARGVDPIIATYAMYREKVEALGLGFRPVRPGLPEGEALSGLMDRVMDVRTGPAEVIRRYFMPALRDSFEDTSAASEGADLLVAHPLTFTVRLVAEIRGFRWASTMLSPMSLFSAYDPPVLAPAQFLGRLRPLGPAFHLPLFRVMRWSIRSWSEPYRRFRAELGLPPGGDPIFDGQHSPHLVLAMMSRLLAPEQPDWPPRTRITGFPFFDRDADEGLEPDLERFLDAGPPPIVFTLGSSAVAVPGRFYEEAAEAARRLRRRAVLLVGREASDRPAMTLPEGVAAFPYAPFSTLLPRAAAIVHQGGVGTTAQAMRSGRPMLVVPFAFDQPDNARRVVRLGIARTISRPRFNARRAASALERLLGDPSSTRRAAEVGEQIRAEDGVVDASEALIGLLGGVTSTSANSSRT
jgi:rhamnosyltransferase subunit B